MTERYTLYDIALLSDRFKLPDGLPKGVKPSYNRRPGTVHPVVLLRDGVRKVELMLWGLLPDHAKDTNSIFRFKTYNVRSELIFDKPSTSTAIRSQRCLIPANGFYDWHKAAGSTSAQYIARADKQVFSLAGVYSSWQAPDGTMQHTYSIITCDSNDDLADITNRMPILVHPEDEATWLDPEVYDANTLYDIMRPCPNGVLQLTAIAPAIATAKADNANLVAPLSTR